MASTSMNIRTDSEVKKQAEELFAQFGLSMSAAINMFLRQSIRKQAIPFELTLDTASEKHSVNQDGHAEKNILELFGNIQFADNYDYKALREGR
ncbi:MAG: type II toxin-antitoxin system RelB/DinJ family antitoxin [Firmicutes bacterium]|nr:type II toxin-antitoxin system RelB/DinJ family antitoxin [Bacillota bacterium]